MKIDFKKWLTQVTTEPESNYLTPSERLKVLLGCCLIHFVIGSIYAWSTLYPQILQITGWEQQTLIRGFALTILFLGITAAFHQRFFDKWEYMPALAYGVIFWVATMALLVKNIQGEVPDPILHYLYSVLLGVGIGVLYVIPVNLITAVAFRPTIAAGTVVCCFGAGSIAAAQLFSTVNLAEFSTYGGIMVYGLVLIIALTIMAPQEWAFPQISKNSARSFIRDRNWYLLALIFFFNIGIGISLLSNLTNLTLERNLSMEWAVILVSLAGVANTLGRFIYPSCSERFGEVTVVSMIADIQGVALILMMISSMFWIPSVIIILSAYGGLFAVMPGIMKKVYNSSAAYSQVLVCWGLAGIVCPIIFDLAGMSALLIMGSALVICSCNIRIKTDNIW